MRLLSRKGILLWLLAVLLCPYCQKELECDECKEANAAVDNKPPIANAGIDQTISLRSNRVTLNGRNSTDPDNNISGYEWTSVSGPSKVTITDVNSVETMVSDFVQGIYQFELKVTDSLGLFSTDTIMITVNEANAVGPTWTRLHSLPENEFLLGSKHINFLIGIQDMVFAVSKNGTLWYYNSQSDTWSKRGDVPSYLASSNFSVVFSVNNIGYLIGNGTCRQYNALTRQWTTRNNAPVGPEHVDYSVPLVIGNKVFLVGSTNNQVTLFDPSSDTYTPKSKFVDVQAATGFVVNGEGYCIQKDGRCWKYDPSGDTWQQKASLPASIYNPSGFSMNGLGYIVGDLNRTAYSQNSRMKVWQYDPTLDQWKQINEDYPGEAALELRTVSAAGIIYAGLGYNSADKDVLDFWRFK